MNKKNCYNYTKTELNKMKKEDLLHILYEQEAFYFESANGSNKNWSSENNFEDFKKSYKIYTRKEILEKINHI